MASVKNVFPQETLPTPERHLAVDGCQLQSEILCGAPARQIL
jgi:hypothetical protein